MWTPFVMLISLAGLSAVPPHLYEAAEVDRASGWFKFRHITLPMIAPLMMVALLFRTMDCFKLFDLVFVLTKGGPGSATETVCFNLYQRAFKFHDTGQACALAYMILLIIIGLANLYMKLLGRIRGEGIPDDSTLFGSFAERVQNVPVLGWLVESPARIVGILALLTFGKPLLGWMLAHLPILLFVTVLIGIGLLSLALRIPQEVRNLSAYAGIAVVLALFLLPIFWIAETSIKPPTDINAPKPKFVFTPTLENYDALIYQREGDRPTGRVLGLTDFPYQLGNSLLIGVVSTVLSVGLGTMAAYALARFRVRAKGDLVFFILSTRMLPAIVVVIPIFLMYSALGLLGTRLGLIILYTVFNLSFSTYLMKGFFDEIPHEYDDAALLDGYSRFSAFRRVSLPQAATGMAATAVFCFITAWNEFAFAQLLAPAQPLTAPPSIIARTGSGGVDWGPIAAGTLLFLIPAAVFTFLMRRHLLRGVTFGAIKR
jgi:multiple sugar transport system permease protein